MILKIKLLFHLLFIQAVISILLLAPALAGPDPIPITAEQAFDAVMTGIDPVSGIKHGVGNVVIVDVRTPPEYQFQGTAGKVDSIQLKGATVPSAPDLGKVRLVEEGRYLSYKIRGKTHKTQIEKVEKLVTSSIAINIPCAIWNQETKEMDPVPDAFSNGIKELAEDGVQAVITMCNSGGRSTACLAKFVSNELASRFKAFYEIDRAGGQYLNPKHDIHLAGLGGFQGSAYSGEYNGYSGFQGRPTSRQSIQGWAEGKPNGPSVSWKDSGLPIFIPETSCNLRGMPPTP
ncbi:hypothetical protein N9934_02825 [Desulfosarcina sp.]|nr:hypothetical protein [Desulfosarcina sp.]